MSIASRLSSKGGTTGGLDPIVKDKDCCKKIASSLAKFFEGVDVKCNDFDFQGSLKQLKNLPTARLVREMYNFFFQELLDLTLPPKCKNSFVLIPVYFLIALVEKQLL